MTIYQTERRAQLIGVGLIGGSIGLALRARGWHVTGHDLDPQRGTDALVAGVIDAAGVDSDAEVVFVATPLASVVEKVSEALATCPNAVVSDVAGVKSPVAGSVHHPRFVGGHPMAGSEQVGIEGSDPDLFVGATWVLTPSAETDPEAYARLRSVVRSLGAEALELTPRQHDTLVAVVSHVPHLTAATLMNLAERQSAQHAALLRLAAGGFRDMTRVAAGQPGIWPDICTENAEAILATLDILIDDLRATRDLVASGSRDGLLELLENASKARRALPARAVQPEDLAELRVPVPDRPGVLAEITTLAGEMGVNIFDVEIAHSAEGDRGVVVLVVGAEESDRLHDALGGRGYRCTVRLMR